MDRIRLIVANEWRAYWRRLSRAGLRSNQGILLLLGVLISIKYVMVLRVAAANVASGNSKLLLQLLAAVFLVWLYPIAANRRDTLASRKWMHLPLSLGERFAVRATSLLIPPAAWLAIAGSLAILYPLAHAQNPFGGILASLLFIATAWLAGLSIAHLLNSPSWRKLLWLVAVALLITGGVYVIKGGRAENLLSYQFLPTQFVVDAAMGDWKSALTSIAILSLLAVAAGAAALWSFRSSLLSAPESAGRRMFSSWLILPGRLGGLVMKDFNYFRKLLDTYLGVAAAALACVYLVVAVEPSAGVFWSLIVVVFLGNAAVPFNSFGLDNRAGMDRYSLLPLTGRGVLLSKNLAYLMIVGAQLSPLLILAGWRLGISAIAIALLEAVALGCAYMAWGNWMSVNHPLKMQFYRFANSGAALVDAMGGVFFGSLPGIVMIYLLHSHGTGAGAGVLLTLMLTVGLYIASLARFGNRFEHTRERIASALS